MAKLRSLNRVKKPSNYENDNGQNNRNNKGEKNMLNKEINIKDVIKQGARVIVILAGLLYITICYQESKIPFFKGDNQQGENIQENGEDNKINRRTRNKKATPTKHEQLKALEEQFKAIKNNADDEPVDPKQK